MRAEGFFDLKTTEFDATVLAECPELKPYLAEASLDVSGMARLQVKAKGTLTAPIVDAQISSERISIWPVTLYEVSTRIKVQRQETGRFAVQLEGDAQRIDLAETSLQLPVIRLSANGEIDAAATRFQLLDANVHTAGISLGLSGGFSSSDGRLSSQFELSIPDASQLGDILSVPLVGAAQLEGILAAPSVAGPLTAEFKGKLREFLPPGHPLARLAKELSASGKFLLDLKSEVLTVEQFKLDDSTISAIGSGKIGLRNSSLNLQTDLNISNIAKLGDALADARGAVSLALVLEGEWSRPQVQMTLGSGGVSPAFD
ncbi:MAG: AsmA-like C-terminal domain-containing protein [Planctomycetota bacterium]|nr:AsmA-like C-terminal domain-containing protein [Planctomycetota bacterium]